MSAMREECEVAVAVLCERLERHDDSRRAVQEKLHEVCNELRRHVDEMEERANRRLEEEFTKEDNRLQSALSELRRCMAVKEEGKMRKEKAVMTSKKERRKEKDVKDSQKPSTMRNPSLLSSRVTSLLSVTQRAVCF